jgi:phage gp46-like protein
MDAALIWNGTAGDVAVIGNDLITDTGLATAVVVSLCSDGRAAFNDELPAGVNERRGWWGVGTTGWGSKLWLLSREKTTRKTAARAREYATKALQWMIDDGIAQAVSVTAEILNPSTIALGITISRSTNKKYDYLWRGMEGNEANTYTTTLNINSGAAS